MTNPVAMLRKVTDGAHRYDALMFCCPGCTDESSEINRRSTGLHMLPVNCLNKSPAWSWDGNIEAPTLSPSILTKTGPDGINICHSYLRNGVFEYLGDCTHKYANQLVPLPPLPDWVVE